MAVEKAGCILLDRNTKKIGLVYRKKLNDYTFPKGHLEKNETLEECAIRETIEETGRDCTIVKKIKIMSYTNEIDGLCETHYYLAVDDGITNKMINEKDKEELVWKDIEEVEEYLSYDDLKELWKEAKISIIELF